jgi:hypothetical protein
MNHFICEQPNYTLQGSSFKSIVLTNEAYFIYNLVSNKEHLTNDIHKDKDIK